MALALAVAVLLPRLACAADDARVPSDLPLGVSPVLYKISVPPGGEPTPAKAALGEKLFNDKRLSVNDTVSCATCHVPEKGFVDHKPLSEGVGAPKQRTQRNSPTVLNAMFNATQFWDGRAPSLEEQAKLPILNPIEMGQKSPDDVVAKVAKLPEYRDAFQKVFGRAPTYDDLAAAIAAFERTQYAGDSPFDQALTFGACRQSMRLSLVPRSRRNPVSPLRLPSSTVIPLIQTAGLRCILWERLVYPTPC